MSEKAYSPEQQDTFGEAWLVTAMMNTFVIGVVWATELFFHTGVQSTLAYIGVVWHGMTLILFISAFREMYRASKRWDEMLEDEKE